MNKANLRDLIAATSLLISHWIQIVSTFQPVWPSNLMDDLKKQQGSSPILRQVLCNISNPSVNSKWSYSPEILNSGQNWQYFVLSDLEIWWITLENNRALLLYYIKLCASFQIHRWSQTWVTVRKRSIQVKIGDFFLSHVTFKFDGWPWKTIGHLFWATTNFVHHFIAACKFKLELWSRNG